MKQKEREKCWDIIWKSSSALAYMYHDGLTGYQQDKVNEALNLAYKFGKMSSKPSLNNSFI